MSSNQYKTCPTCEGSGIGADGDPLTSCYDCNGTGGIEATEVGAKPTLADVVHGTPAGQKAVDKAIEESHKVMQSMTPNQDNNFEQELDKLQISEVVERKGKFFAVPQTETRTKLIAAHQSSLEEAYNQGYDDCLKEHGFTNINTKTLTKDQKKQ